MIDFQPLEIEKKAVYDKFLKNSPKEGCEYNFINLYMWGRQKAAICGDFLVFFSQFNRKSVYLYPAGQGDVRPVVERIMQDAQKRGIPCRLTSLSQEDCQNLELLFPGKFRFHCDRNAFDYVYSISDLADLPGRKYQKKRNHANRFWQSHPDARFVELTEENLSVAEELLQQWFAQRLAEDPHGDFHMEQAALARAMKNYTRLGMEGLLLMDGQTPLAVTIGSFLKENTVDVHFEKALQAEEGTYTAINQGFARYLREKYPQLQWLNREDDMGIEGLRKAKISYCPAKMVEKYWACLVEDGCDY